MRIGSFQKISLIDYPGYISCIIFTQGCNFRCKYCHNPELVYPELFKEEIKTNVIFDYLIKRKSLVESVVITGGEPTIYHDTLIDFIKEVKNLGYKIKIYSNASNPYVLDKVLPYLDSISLDIKASLDDKENYSRICGIEVDLEKLKESIKLVIDSSLEFEIRTTLYQNFVKEKDVKNIKEFFKDNYNLETFNHFIQEFNKHFRNNFY